MWTTVHLDSARKQTSEIRTDQFIKHKPFSGADGHTGGQEISRNLWKSKHGQVRSPSHSHTPYIKERYIFILLHHLNLPDTPTQCPVQWAPGLLPVGKAWR